MNTSYVPETQDQSLQMENGITKTATFSGTPLDNGLGFSPGGNGMPVNAVIDITAIDGTSGDETYTVKLQESADTVTWVDIGPSVSLTRGTPVCLAIPGVLSQRYVRVNLAVGGTSPAITYSAWLSPYGFSAVR